MENEQKSRIHPLAAGAAIAVIVAAAVGVAAMTGHLPGTNAEPAAAPQISAAPAPAPVAVARTESAEQKAERQRAEHRGAEQERERERVRNQHMADATQSRAQSRPACANCGTVESVHAVQQQGQGGAVGMVGGGVVGALVGSQIGHGAGTTIAEVAGAAGGAYLGNEVQKKVTTTTHYEVLVRLEGGGTQTITYPTQPAFSVGSRVRVENGTLVLI